MLATNIDIYQQHFRKFNNGIYILQNDSNIILENNSNMYTLSNIL